MADKVIEYLSRTIYAGQLFEYRIEGEPTRWFAIEAMIPWAREHGEKVRFDIQADWVVYATIKCGVEMDRVAALTDKQLAEPVIVIEEENKSLLVVDGHHRIVRLFQDGVTEVRAYLIADGQWQQFLIEGIPEEFSIGAKPK